MVEMLVVECINAAKPGLPTLPSLRLQQPAPGLAVKHYRAPDRLSLSPALSRSLPPSLSRSLPLSPTLSLPLSPTLYHHNRRGTSHHHIPRPGTPANITNIVANPTPAHPQPLPVHQIVGMIGLRKIGIGALLPRWWSIIVQGWDG